MTGSVSPTPDLAIPLAPESSGKACIGIEALRRLRSSGYSALWDVSCDVHGESMRLRDRLPTYFLKQMAQAIVAEVEGMRQVINLIEVTAPAGGVNRLGD